MDISNHVIKKVAKEGFMYTDGIIFAKEIQCYPKDVVYLNSGWKEVEIGNPEVSDKEVIEEILSLLNDNE